MTMFTRNDKMPEANVSGKPLELKESEMSTPTPRNEDIRPSTPAPARAPNSTPSVIIKALKITGQLESSEDIQIDGDVDGDIRGVSVKVGNGATIKGTVYGEAVELAGTVNGKIEAKHVLLTKTARMSGDVSHQDIQIESGAYIDGHCRPDFGKTTNTARPLHAVAPPLSASNAVHGSGPGTTAGPAVSANEKDVAKKLTANGNGAKAEFGSL